jgi:hypothetical protein
MSNAKSLNVPTYSLNTAPITAMARGHGRCSTSALPGELLRDNRSTSTSVSV